MPSGKDITGGGSGGGGKRNGGGSVDLGNDRRHQEERLLLVLPQELPRRRPAGRRARRRLHLRRVHRALPVDPRPGATPPRRAQDRSSPTSRPRARSRSSSTQYVIGQDRAKKVLRSPSTTTTSGSVHGEEPDSEVEIDKSNILLIGPTGCGKTLLARTLARILNVPFAIGDATTLTEAGYVGEDVENLLLKLLHAADFDLEAAQRGIIYIDEIDKIGKTQPQRLDHPRRLRRRRAAGPAEDARRAPSPTSRRRAAASTPSSSTSRWTRRNILFICGGTFVGLDDIIARRVGRKTIGFGSQIAGRAQRRAGRPARPGHLRRPARVRHDPRVRRPPAGHLPARCRSTSTRWSRS